MKTSSYKNYDDLPLFLNATMVAKVLLPTKPKGGFAGAPFVFPVLRVGSRMVVPKEKFVEWVERHTGGQQ